MDDVRQRRPVAEAGKEEVKEQELGAEGKRRLEQPCQEETLWAVSYTHLTLPTILRV